MNLTFNFKPLILFITLRIPPLNKSKIAPILTFIRDHMPYIIESSLSGWEVTLR